MLRGIISDSLCLGIFQIMNLTIFVAIRFIYMKKIISFPLIIVAIATQSVLGNNLKPFDTDSLTVNQEQAEKQIAKGKVSTLLFLGYRYTSFSEGNTSNEFVVSRGYINFTGNVSPYFSGRITPDITRGVDGDLEMRLKYCFAQYKNVDMQGFIAEPSVRIGQVHTPFIEYESKINRYRVVESYFLNRIKQLPSSDFGVTFTALLGGKIDAEYQKKVNSNHAGRYGSVAFGFYNGGGYNALERNSNKAFQWRVSVRPLPDVLPGFQTSFFGSLGKGNLPESPDWKLLGGFLSYEQQRFVITGQYYQAVGNYTGAMIDGFGVEQASQGYSLFSEVNLFKQKSSVFARWDYDEIDKNSPKYTSKYIVGLAYHIQSKSKIVIDYSFLDSSHGGIDIGILELMFELAF